MTSQDFSLGEKFKTKTLPSSSPKTIPVTLHEHFAEKAGRHFDLRLGGRGDWAIRHFPVASGEKRLAVRQPTHPLNYYGFEGEISEGYGKGRVSLKYRGTGEVESWDSKKINFGFDGNRYTLIQTNGDQWLILKRSDNIKTASHQVTRIQALEGLGDFFKQIGIKADSPTVITTNDGEKSGLSIRANSPIGDDAMDPNNERGVVIRGMNEKMAEFNISSARGLRRLGFLTNRVLNDRSIINDAMVQVSIEDTNGKIRSRRKSRSTKKQYRKYN